MASSPHIPQDVRDVSFETIGEFSEDWEQVRDELEDEGFFVDDLDAVIGNADFQAVMSKFDKDDFRLKRDRNRLQDIENEGDNLAAIAKVKRYLNLLEPSSRNADTFIANWLRNTISKDDNLAIKLYDLVNKVGSNVLNKRKSDIAELAALLKEVDIESKTKTIQELRESRSLLSQRTKYLEFRDAYQKLSLEQLTEYNANLRVELAVRPVEFQVEDEDEDVEQEFKQIVENSIKIQDFPTRWSDLAHLLAEKENIDTAAFEKEKENLQNRLDILMQNDKKAVAHLTAERSRCETLRKNLADEKTKNAQLAKELEDTEVKGDRKIEQLRQHISKLQDAANKNHDDIRDLKQEIRLKDGNITLKEHTIKTLETDIKAVKAEFSDHKVEAARAAGQVGGDVREWTLKYHNEVLARRHCEQNCDGMKIKTQDLEQEVRKKNDDLIAKTGEAGKVLARATKAEAQYNAGANRIIQLEKENAQHDDKIAAKVAIIAEHKSEMEKVQKVVADQKLNIQALEAALTDKRREIEAQRQECKKLLDDAAKVEDERVEDYATKLRDAQQAADVQKDQSRNQLQQIENEHSSDKERWQEGLARLQEESDENKKAFEDVTSRLVSTEGSLKKSRDDSVEKDTMIESLRHQLWNHDATNLSLQTQIEITVRVKGERDHAQQNVKDLSHTVANWRRVFVEYAMGRSHDVDLEPVLLSLDILWPTTYEAITAKSAELSNGFEILAGQPVTALQLWLKSVFEPNSLKVDNLFGLLRNGLTPREIGFLVTTIQNVNNLPELNEHVGLFLVRSIEFLYLILIGGQQFQPIKDMVGPLETRLPDVPIVKAFYSFLRDRLAGGTSERGEHLLPIAPDGLDLTENVRAYAWGEYVCIVRNEIIEIRFIKDLRFELDETTLVIWIKDYPAQSNELKAKIPYSVDTSSKLMNCFPNATWGIE